MLFRSGVWTANGALADVNTLLAGLTFTPAANFNANFSIATRVSDGVAAAITGTKSMTGTPVNDAPVAYNGSASTGENTTLNTSVPAASVVDGIASYALVGSVGAGNGSLSFNPDGSYSFNPGTNFDGLAVGATRDVSFTYSATDNDGAVSTSATITITVTGTDDATVISGTSTASLTESNAAQTTGATLVASDPDSSNAFVVQSGVAGSNGFGSFFIDAAGVWTYAMNTAHDEFVAGVTYTDSISVASADGTTQLITVSMLGTNDAPLVTSDGGGVAASVIVAENQTTVTSVTSTDVDGGTLVFSISGGADAARFSIDSATGALAFNSAPDFETPADVGADNVYDVSVQVADGNGGFSTQALAITLTGVNEAPSITGLIGGAVLQGASAGTVVATVSASDPDSGTVLTFNLLVDAGGRFVIDPASGRISVADPSLLGDSAQHRITVRVSDGSGASDLRELILLVQALPAEASTAQAPALPPPAALPVVEAPAPAPAPATSAAAKVPVELERPGWRQTEFLRAGGKALPSTEEAHAATAAAQRYGREGRDDGVPIGSTSFNLLSPAEIALNLATAAESSPMGSIDALLRNSFGFARGQPLESDVAEQATAGNDQRPTALVDVISDPLRIASVTLTAGFVWWLTRGGGLMATMLMSLPAWRHVDLLPVLARRLDDEDINEDDDVNQLRPSTALGGLDDSDDAQLVYDESQLDSGRSEFEDSALGALFEPRETTEVIPHRP